MSEVFKGTLYALCTLLNTDWSGVYILNDSTDWSWENDGIANLGMKRLLPVSRGRSWLVIWNAEDIVIEKLEFPEAAENAEQVYRETGKDIRPQINIADFIRSKGIKCRVIAQYSRGFGTAARPSWRKALCDKQAIVSENGIATQFKVDLFDVTYYHFRIFFKNNVLKIDGRSIETISADDISQDIMGKAKDFIVKALEQPNEISFEALSHIVEETGLRKSWNDLRYIEWAADNDDDNKEE